MLYAFQQGFPTVVALGHMRYFIRCAQALSIFWFSGLQILAKPETMDSGLHVSHKYWQHMNLVRTRLKTLKVCHDLLVFGMHKTKFFIGDNFFKIE